MYTRLRNIKHIIPPKAKSISTLNAQNCARTTCIISHSGTFFLVFFSTIFSNLQKSISCLSTGENIINPKLFCAEESERAVKLEQDSVRTFSWGVEEVLTICLKEFDYDTTF